LRNLNPNLIVIVVAMCVMGLYSVVVIILTACNTRPKTEKFVPIIGGILAVSYVIICALAFIGVFGPKLPGM